MPAPFKLLDSKIVAELLGSEIDALAATDAGRLKLFTFYVDVLV